MTSADPSFDAWLKDVVGDELPSLSPRERIRFAALLVTAYEYGMRRPGQSEALVRANVAVEADREEEA